MGSEMCIRDRDETRMGEKPARVGTGIRGGVDVDTGVDVDAWGEGGSLVTVMMRSRMFSGLDEVEV